MKNAKSSTESIDVYLLRFTDYSKLMSLWGRSISPYELRDLILTGLKATGGPYQDMTYIQNVFLTHMEDGKITMATISAAIKHFSAMYNNSQTEEYSMRANAATVTAESNSESHGSLKTKLRMIKPTNTDKLPYFCAHHFHLHNKTHSTKDCNLLKKEFSSDMSKST